MAKHGGYYKEMKINVYAQSTMHDKEREILKAIHEGISSIETPHPDNDNIQRSIKHFNKSKGRGYGVHYVYDEKCKGKEDLAVMLGSWKPRKSIHHEVRNSIVHSDVNFLCIETPLLGRKVFQPNQQWRIGINGFLAGDAIFTEEKNYSGVRLRAQNIVYEGWKKSRGDKVIITLQLSGDASLRGANINHWCINQINELRKHTDRPIEIRLHPGVSDKGIDDHIDLYKYLAFENPKDVKLVAGRDLPWEDHILDAHCIVAYSSGISVDAVLNGIPVIACDPGNFAYNISSNHVEAIEKPKMELEETVQQWLHNLSYCQWSVEEMRNGTAWHHLKPLVEELLEEENEDSDNLS